MGVVHSSQKISTTLLGGLGIVTVGIVHIASMMPSYPLIVSSMSQLIPVRCGNLIDTLGMLCIIR